MAKVETYYKELKSKHRIYHVGPTGLEITIDEEGNKHHPRLTKQERYEFTTLVKIENLLAKATYTRDEFRELLSVPYKANLDPFSVYSHILEEKMKPAEAKLYLEDLTRYHGLLWRG